MTTPAALAWSQPRVKFALAAFAGVLIAVVLAATVGGVPWRDYVRRQAPAVVSISFVDPATLPSTTAAGGAVHFRFSVDNQQQRSYDGSYTTSVVDTVTKASQPVRSAPIHAAAGATVTVDTAARLAGTHRQEVRVVLASGQSIDFYVTPKAAKAKTPVAK